MNSKTLCIIALVLLEFSALNGCGNGGSPVVSFSANSLTFGDEEEGSTSEPLLITLTNSGTAPLTITSIAVSANFAETNTCGTTLAAGANCAINVTLAPSTTGSVKGTVTFTDNAAGSPQTVSLSGTAVTPSALTGLCVGEIEVGYNLYDCENSEQPTRCAVGQPAVTPMTETFSGCGGKTYVVDTSTQCYINGRPWAHCQATSAVVSCSVQGQQCGGTLPGCCSGFTCTAGTGGSFCQPAAGSSASGARSSWDRGLADRLR
jgi:HYDIN/CFA65/VesB-like, Ig-like domain